MKATFKMQKEVVNIYMKVPTQFLEILAKEYNTNALDLLETVVNTNP